LRVGGYRRGDGAALLARNVLARAFAVLSLLAVLNLAVAPLAHAAGPQRASVEQLAADMKATFGDAFQLCVNVGDDGSAPSAPVHHGDGDCPLCCVHAGAVLTPPEAVALPARREAVAALTFVAKDFAPPPPARASPAQARAPPKQS